MDYKNQENTLFQRLFREFGELALITAYFYAAFVTLILFKATVLHSYGVHYVVWGAAIFKAVLIAKFMMIGRAMKIGDGHAEGALLRPILYKTIEFLIFLLIMTGIEETTVGLFHHRSMSVIFHGFAGPSLGASLTEVLLLLLILVPFIGFTVLSEALGEGSLRRMLFKGGTTRVDKTSRSTRRGKQEPNEPRQTTVKEDCASIGGPD